MEGLSDEKIKKLKAAHGDIFKGRIKYRDENKVEKNIEFVHRKPTFEDYEGFQADMVKMGGAVANQNLIVGMVVTPEGTDIAKQLGSCPVAVDRWVLKNVLPYFGGDVEEVSSEKL